MVICVVEGKGAVHKEPCHSKVGGLQKFNCVNVTLFLTQHALLTKTSDWHETSPRNPNVNVFNWYIVWLLSFLIFQVRNILLSIYEWPLIFGKNMLGWHFKKEKRSKFSNFKNNLAAICTRLKACFKTDSEVLQLLMFHEIQENWLLTN